ncbi:hypothetical protein [Nocardioides hungaricus]
MISNLRELVSASGLTQGQFAFAVGSRPGRFSEWLSGAVHPYARAYVRCLRIGGGLAVAAERGVLSTPATCLRIKKHVRLGEVESAWRMVLRARGQLRELLGEEDSPLVGAWEAEPLPTESAQWDTLLAVVVEREFVRAERGAPEWARGRGPLTRPWQPLHPLLASERAREQSPGWLRRLNIYIPRDDLDAGGLEEGGPDVHGPAGS